MIDIRPLSFEQLDRGCGTPFSGDVNGVWFGRDVPGVDGSQPCSMGELRQLASWLTGQVDGSSPLFEVSVEAPAAVSVLWATQPDGVRVQVVEAFARAIDGTLRMLDATHVRAETVGGSGVRPELAGSISGCVYVHYFDWKGRPGLHAHAYILNTVPTVDRRLSSLDVTTFLRAEDAALDHYVELFRRHLNESLGVDTWRAPDDDGHLSFEVSGVDPELIWALPVVHDAGSDASVARNVSAGPATVKDERLSVWGRLTRRLRR